jgi:preprotein translocase subunit SecD
VPEVSVAIELRPVVSMALPGQDEYEALAERLGRDVFYRDMDGNGSFTDGVELLFVLGDAIVGAGDYASATVVPPPSEYRDQWQVSFTLTPDGADRLSAATADAVGEEIAIVEGDRILSVPTIEEPITNGEGVVVVPSQEEAEEIVGIMLGS